MSKLVKAHIALFTVNLLYGANYIIAKGVMPNFLGANTFVFLRVIGALTLFAVIMLFVKEKVSAKDKVKLALCGLFGVAINQLLFFNGLMLTSPINASIIMTSNPVIVLVLASLLIKERVTKNKIIGIILGMLGSIILTLLSASGTSKHASVLGDSFILLNSVSYATYLVLVKPLMAKYKPITVIFWVFFFGLAYVSPIGIPEAINTEWQHLTMPIIGSVLFVVVGVTFLAYLLNIFALKIVSPSVTSSYIYLQPVMAGLFAWIHSSMYNSAYAEDITWIKVMCALLIFTGVYLVSKPPVSS